MLIRKFTKSIIDLNVVLNVWPTSCYVRYVVYNITVKLTMNSDIGGIIVRITIRNFYGIKIINKQAFLLTSKQLAISVLLITLK